ncbi:MAG: response regulator transcription factor [Gammaproteobacteria bacterium]|nr:response regulator transcription factor [Gammaproteobacteria bacterium]
MERLTYLTPPLIYLLDDDPVFTATTVQLLKFAGYHGNAFNTPEAFAKAMKIRLPCLAIIDIELGEGSGLDLIALLRQQYSAAELPLVVLTNHDYDDNYLLANSHKVNAFLEKRRDFMVLKSSIDNILQNLSQQENSTTAKDEWLLDTLHWVLYRKTNGKKTSVKLSEKESLLLDWLSRHHGQVLSRDHILTLFQHADASYINSARSIDSLIRHLRSKMVQLMGEDGDLLIESVYGRGYRLMVHINVH